MNILFLHPNFPAQFKITSNFAAKCGHDVKFLCQTHYGRIVEGVERITLKRKAGKQALDNLKLPVFERAQELASQYRLGLIGIKQTGWMPDIVISHSGWGCGLYVKEIWPKTKLISYCEWWFNAQSEFFSYDSKNSELLIGQKSLTKAWIRNQHIGLELITADKIVSPTAWQKKQLPELLQSNCEVIFDGIDQNIFNLYGRKKSINDKKVITYGTRGMEPMRCFPQFIRSIPDILAEDSNIFIEIAGRDEAFYAETKPSDSSKTWGEWAKKFLCEAGVSKKIKWVGMLEFNSYVEWLSNSDCHIYLSHPFVMSWSLVESYCLGVPIVTSDIEATKEICGSRKGVWYADHRNRESIHAQTISCLNHKSSDSLENALNSRLIGQYSKELSMELWRRLWLV